MGKSAKNFIGHNFCLNSASELHFARSFQGHPTWSYLERPNVHIWPYLGAPYVHRGGGVCIKHFWLELLRQWLLDDWDEQNSTALWFLRCHLVFSSGADGNSIYLDIIVFTIHLFLNKKSTKRAYIFLTIYTWRRTSAKGMKRLKTSQ